MSGGQVCLKESASIYFGGEEKNEKWRKRYNYELYEKFNERNIVNYIKVKRLAWTGQLVHMNNDRMLKKIITKPE
jgi:hypothetical protein